MKLETQTRILSILIMGLIMLVLMLSIMASGMMDGTTSDAADVTDNPDWEYTKSDLENMVPPVNMRVKTTGNTVKCEYIGNQSADISWSFGDGIGAINKNPATHEYPDSSSNKDYVIIMSVNEDYGRQYSEYTVVNIKANTLADFTIPMTDNHYRLFISTLMITGITSLIFAIALFWIDIPPRAFTQRLRVIVGIAFILCYGIAVGFFNGLIGG